MGVKKINVEEMKLCKENPNTYKTNKKICNDIPNLTKAETLQCMKDPTAFAQKRVTKADEKTKQAKAEKTCKETHNLKQGTVPFAQCMKDPANYKNNKKTCDKWKNNPAQFNKCMDNPTKFEANKNLEEECEKLGAKSGANKKLCMNDIKTYTANKTKCDKLTGNDFDKCVQNPEEYKKKQDLEKAAKAEGQTVHQYQKAQKDNETTAALRQLLNNQNP